MVPAKMIPLAIPNLCGNEKKYLSQCIDTNFVSYMGPFVAELEKKTAEASGARYAAAMSSGTTGLHLALVALGVKKGDCVIVPSLTFIASANAVMHAGAQPILLDVNPESWTLDPEGLSDFLKKKTKPRQKIAAIMPVYTLGVPADMDAINTIAKRYGIPVVADGAAALGASYKGRPVGNLADLTVFSFNGNKTVTAGGGGMITGDNQRLLARAKHLSTTARLGGLEYRHDEVGFNYRMTNVQAAVGCAQIEKLSEFVAAKKKIRQVYNDAFSSISGVGLFPSPSWADSACWISGITLNDVLLPDVLGVCEALKQEGIEGKPFWRPIHLQAPYRQSPHASLSVCNKLWNKILTLPSSTQLTQEEQSFVIRSTKTLLKKGRKA